MQINKIMMEEQLTGLLTCRLENRFNSSGLIRMREEQSVSDRHYVSFIGK